MQWQWFDRLLLKMGIVRISMFTELLERDGGISKRLDEHRSAVQFLESECSRAISDNSWLRGIFRRQDCLLEQLHILSQHQITSSDLLKERLKKWRRYPVRQTPPTISHD